MTLLSAMPPADRRVLRDLYRKRLTDGLVVCAEARSAAYSIDPDFSPEWGCLSIVAVTGGREVYRFPEARRTLCVDDDVYLAIDPTSRYSYRLESRGAARCLMVSFPRSMVTSAMGYLSNDVERGWVTPHRWDGFSRLVSEHLLPHGDAVSTELRRIERAHLDGIRDPEWYRQQMSLLLTAFMCARHREFSRRNDVSRLRPSTRAELAEKAALAMDCIHQEYHRPLDLETLAKAATMSPFQLLRVFKEVYRVTPQDSLQRKRAAVARRLLGTTRLSTIRVAARVGFRSKSSLYRWLRRVDTSS